MMQAVQACDARVSQAREELGFTFEAGESIRVTRDGDPQNFDRDFTVERRVDRFQTSPIAPSPSFSTKR